MAGYLTTHVLDTSAGRPAEGMRIELYRIEGEARTLIRTTTTNADGRTDGAMLPEDEFVRGVYELIFHIGDWLDAAGAPGEAPRFLDLAPIRFGMAEDGHYHVPLIFAPHGYSTYRGS
ncbi:hydroxyisourate hydrolase [Pikeienuella piscinae]|uniref:5-hydroxyisourate hydrolase n=1 Tax=Pikeienuella piscinae TaxID=2748098 RepID=A0A7L5BUD9_9RHOB|nr:hydroxyisourate hydrolase [Pikeienuella piscinae]QIE55870.1 hydroxyisourate hydrolase [Pikeienuella piscinae]